MPEVHLTSPTLAAVQQACDVLQTPEGDPVTLDDLLAADTVPTLPDGRERELLAVLVETGRVPDAVERQAAGRLARCWLQVVIDASARASERAMAYAEELAVDDVLKQQGSDGQLARVVARCDADAYHILWHEMGLEDAVFYLMMRSVDHIHENLDEFLV